MAITGRAGPRMSISSRSPRKSASLAPLSLVSASPYAVMMMIGMLDRKASAQSRDG
jgi:hypothetical protein